MRPSSISGQGTAGWRQQGDIFFFGIPFWAVGNVYHDCVLLFQLNKINYLFFTFRHHLG